MSDNNNDYNDDDVDDDNDDFISVALFHVAHAYNTHALWTLDPR